jgi:hypothetical protein
LAKESRTYRLSNQALTIIEDRDKGKDRYATDFVERRILETLEEKKTVDILEELEKIRRDLDFLKAALVDSRQNRTSLKTEEDYDLPITGF